VTTKETANVTTIDLGDGVYQITAAGEGSPVLFLHGFSGSRHDWAPFMASVAGAHMAIAADLLGHGGSWRPTDPDRYELSRQAADVAAIIERLGAGPAIVVAYSYGARLALRIAVDHGALVAGLALESPSAGIADVEERAARHAADAILAHDLERDGIDAFVERWAALPLFAGERRLPAPVREDLARRGRANDPSALAAALRGAGQGVMTPLHDHLGAIAVPSAILAGALDPAGLARARIVAAGIPAATLDVIEDVGHAPHREAPDRFAAWLAASIDRITSPPPVLVPSSQRRRSP
jgi:2-succinyl-6-hydroxy-2,4-cyclohexadiene-1-carboxylate synthase